jgi:tyrosinase
MPRNLTSRRQFLGKAAAAGSAFVASGAFAGRADAEITSVSPELAYDARLHVRMSIGEFVKDKDMLAAFRCGVERMRAMDPTHPFSWIFQANMHRRPTFPDYVYRQAASSNDPAQRLFHDRLDITPSANIFGHCAHHNWWFLPWHRAYVFYFERILRWATGKPDFALPYWDYTSQAGAVVPEVLRCPTAGGKPNSLFVPALVRFTDDAGRQQEFAMRSEELNEGEPIPDAFVSLSPLTRVAFTNSLPHASDASFGGQRSTGLTTPMGVGGAFEVLYDIFHAAIGGCRVVDGDIRRGFMFKTETAPRDPLFWVLHSNVDRLWSSWLAWGGGRVNPSDSEWLEQPFTFYDVAGEKPSAVTVRVRQLLDTKRQLGYVYDRLATS